MIYLILASLLVVSVGLGVLIKRKVPDIQVTMAILLSFLAVMILAIAAAEALGGLRL